MRRTGLLMLIAVALLGAGCDQKGGASKGTSTSTSNRPIVVAPSVPVLARVHWQGKKDISANPNSAGLMRIWNEGESARLGTQTLDRLSEAPWRLTKRTPDTNAAALLRPLLDDVVDAESYLEIRGATNQPGELAFAIRLSAERAILWKTNLASVLEALTGIRPVSTASGGSLKKHDAPDLIQWTRVGNWTLLGIGHGTNALFDDFIARLQSLHVPYPLPIAPFWLETDFDLRQVARAFSLDLDLPENCPAIFLTTVGDGERVRTQGEMTFLVPPSLMLEPWTLPTNLVRGPLGSFTALRGVQPLLAPLTAWKNLGIGEPPNQLFTWSGEGVPMQILLAVPVSDASNRMSEISSVLLSRTDAWLTTNRAGKLTRSSEFDGLVWEGIPPFMAPFLQSQDNFVIGGLFTRPAGAPSLPPDMLQVLSRTNLVYYDWEITGPRVDSWLHVGQLLRVIMHKPQLPESATLSWLQTNTTQLGNCVTIVSQTKPTRLSFVRNSTVGFTGLELHLLGDWLESPQFPAGIYTLLAQPPTRLQRKQPGTDP